MVEQKNHAQLPTVAIKVINNHILFSPHIYLVVWFIVCVINYKWRTKHEKHKRMERNDQRGDEQRN